MENVSEQDGLFQILKIKYFLSKIKEIHIHDYNEKDHLQLQKGVMNLGMVSSFILNNNLEVPIILEVTIAKPEEDGEKQVSIMRKYLERQ